MFPSREIFVLRNAEGAEGNYYERWHCFRRAGSPGHC
jgi:hypothetical protein